MSGSGIPRVTVDRKMLVHLFELEHSDMDFEVPVEAVQDGIAESISVRRDNIPRTVKKLKEEDLIFEELKRVKGLARKRKAYFLTPRGQEVAAELKEEIGDHRITINMLDGSVKHLPLKDLPNFLGVKMTTNEILSLLRSDSTIKEKDVRSYLADTEQPLTIQRSGDYVSLMQDVPIPRKFFGREDELSEISDWIDERSSSILAITGIAGIGKTTLAARSAKEVEGWMHIFWYRFHKWDSLRNFLYSIARFLEEVGKPSFKKYLDSSKEIEKKDLYPILKKSLRTGPFLLVFDDFQRAADEIVEFFSDLKEMLQGTKGIKVMVIGRQIFPFYDRSDVLLNKMVRELNLSGLDRDSSRDLLKVEDVSDEMFDKVYKVTMGHPLFLQLVLSASDLEDQKDIKRYIYEEIFKKLRPKESLLLQISSVFRYPVPSSAFFMEEGLDFETLDRLVDKNLIQETSYDEYEAHDLIKEFFYNRLTPRQRLEYHRKAAEFYMEEGTESATVEAMYHLAMSGETMKALKLASTYGERIITMGLVEQFSSVLDLLDRKGIRETKQYASTTHLLKGEVEMIMGRWDKAVSHFKRSAAISEAEDDNLINSRSNLKLGSIEMLRGNRDRAKKRLEKSLKLARKLTDRKQMAKSLQALGELYSARGEIDKAVEYFEEALEISKEVDEPSIEAASLIGLGIIYTNVDRTSEAVGKFHDALEILESRENILETARVRISLGTVEAMRGDLQEAIKNFEDAIEISSDAGDIRQEGYALAGAASVYMRTGEHDIALNYLNEALSIFTSLGEQFKIASVHKDLGKLYLIRDKKRKAKKEFKRTMEILDRIGSGFYLERNREDIMRSLKKAGLNKEAKEIGSL